jgi:toluene monooxygenase system protein D
MSGSGVGPVLQSTPFARLIIAAIEDENDDLTITDEGAYLRVLAPQVCRLSRESLEAAAGSPVRFPGDLEILMPSFAGKMRLTEQGAVWWLATEPPPEPPG